MLWAPEEFWQLSEAERAEFRCGPGRGILEKLIPDVWWVGFPIVRPLCVTPACAIHDHMYGTGPNTIGWKGVADRSFMNNLIRLVENAGGPRAIVCRRLDRCNLYYKFVRDFGGPAFWAGRNKESELGWQNCLEK
jgi:hypothetical protein